MMTEPEDIVRAWHVALNQGDIERLVALSSNDVEVGGDAANVSRIASQCSGKSDAMAHNDDGPPEPVPDPERLADFRASVAIYQPPSASPTYITEAEAKRIANIPEGAKYALQFVPYAAVEQIHPPLHGNALVPSDRMVWIVAVAAETMTRASLRFPSQPVHGYSLVIDGETGHAFSHGSGVLALDVR